MIYAIKKARRNGAAMEENMDYRRKVGLVADILSQARNSYLKVIAWELRDRLQQQPPLTRQEAERLLRRAERAAATAAAWEAATRQPRQ
jgi:hypothetical protein